MLGARSCTGPDGRGSRSLSSSCAISSSQLARRLFYPISKRFVCLLRQVGDESCSRWFQKDKRGGSLVKHGCLKERKKKKKETERSCFLIESREVAGVGVYSRTLMN